MTEFEKKALALVNEVAAERGTEYPCVDRRNDARWEALCRAIEQHEVDKAAHAATVEGILKAHEAYKQEVSDAVESYFRVVPRPRDILERFIIPKPVDPLVEAMVECGFGDSSNAADDIRAALAKRGFKIVEDV